MKKIILLKAAPVLKLYKYNKGKKCLMDNYLVFR